VRLGRFDAGCAAGRSVADTARRNALALIDTSAARKQAIDPPMHSAKLDACWQAHTRQCQYRGWWPTALR